MQSNFKPVHLKNANAKLDKLLWEASAPMQENDDYEKKVSGISLWKKFLGLFGR
ncbi:hypothetical protein [Sulfurovum sp.]|uniref:hypothetical protein n=1 Tax=Sulfurovum sp. TaxID=1969726 RepID=UPI002867E3A1|nr:hypothetical protein [Sulfurovum sp.]